MVFLFVYSLDKFLIDYQGFSESFTNSFTFYSGLLFWRWDHFQMYFLFVLHFGISQQKLMHLSFLRYGRSSILVCIKILGCGRVVSIRDKLHTWDNVSFFLKMWQKFNISLYRILGCGRAVSIRDKLHTWDRERFGGSKIDSRSVRHFSAASRSSWSVESSFLYTMGAQNDDLSMFETFCSIFTKTWFNQPISCYELSCVKKRNKQ